MPEITELPNIWIPLKDGRRLSARIWRPSDAAANPVPAIVEYLPYRKRDGTAPRDESTYPVFAAAGYAGVRVDIAGNGESDGIFDDEYSEQELSDGEEVIHWIAEQPWCTGSVGIMGISWGGFNSLQLSARGIAPLKAAISLNSVVDRYNQDIHYKNGCQLSSNFGWANVMLCYASRAPDPALRSDWKEIWLGRLKAQPWLLETWLGHQRRDAYWQRGSVCEDYARLDTPVLIMGGWADLYVDAPVDMIENMQAPCKAINGPWIHKYPHFAWPKPRMDFHAEALQWWDRWLKNIPNQVEDKPAYRAFISENTRAAAYRAQEQGRWVQETQWPPAHGASMQFYLDQNTTLSKTPPVKNGNDAGSTLTICSPQDCGIQAGEVFTLRPDGELPGDQRTDDAGSSVFETGPLNSPVEILGQPTLELDVAIDKPLGNIIVRLLDVHPDGMSHRVSWGAVNLAHRNGNENPQPMTPGEPALVTIKLEQCGYRFLPGHKLRVAISTAYWPLIQPPPQHITASLILGRSAITLPVRPGGDNIEIPEPANPDPLPEYQSHLPAIQKRWIEHDLQNRQTRYHVYDDTGEDEHPDHALRTRHVRDESWSISPEDPATAKSRGCHTFWMTRGKTALRTVCQSALDCDETHFYLSANVQAFEGNDLVNEKSWELSIPRDCI